MASSNVLPTLEEPLHHGLINYYKDTCCDPEAKWPRRSVLNLSRKDQGRSKPVNFEFSKKIEMVLMGYSGVQGKLIHKKS
jgi:hypothetical protein